MNYGKEFHKYAVKHKGINSNTLDNYLKHSIPNTVASIPPWGVGGADVTSLTPNIIEERPMNIGNFIADGIT